MSDRASRANELHKKGYNCAQAVTCVFAEDLGISEQDMFRMMEGFGLGMGTMGTCGAVSAMAAIVGLHKSDGNLEKPRTKRDCYKDMRELTKKFQDKNQSIICREIKGVETGVILRSCEGCIEDAIEFLEEYLSE